MNQQPSVRQRGSSALLQLAGPLLVLILLGLAWQLLVTLLQVSPVLLPGPRAVMTAGWKIRDSLLVATGRTAVAALGGLLVSCCCGTVTAFVFAQSQIIRRALYPYAVLLQTVPVIAIAPIIIVSLGRGFLSVALVACILSLFPIITSTTTGLLQTDPLLQDLFRLHRATRWQTLIRLRVPGALPYLISGIRIASGSAIVGAIVGEFFVGSSESGLGALIQRKSTQLVLSELYATVITATLLGTLVFSLITVLSEQVLRRWFGMSLSGRN
jgi:NitT/TauT family transport system permease protein